MASEPTIDELVQVHRQAREAFEKGDYARALNVCQPYAELDATILPIQSRRHALALRNERARALRNSGRIRDALQEYVSALKEAHLAGDSTDKAWQLVKLGKLFGKYMQRQMFFSACLREAEAILVTDLRSSEPETLIRFAIVQDLLGSHYRAVGTDDRDKWKEAIASHRTAIRYHRLAENGEGMSRAICHMAYSLAHLNSREVHLSQPSRRRLRSALILFEHGAGRAYGSPDARRGRATRRAQHGAIYLMLGQVAESLSVLEEAVQDARDPDDPRALCLALRLLGKAQFLNANPEEALRQLEMARLVASERRFSSLHRHVLPDLVGVYLALDEPTKAVECLEENDTLVEKELSEFGTGFGGALDLFRQIAPENGDRYLREGQQQDFEVLTNELIQNGRLLRELVARHQRARSGRLQYAVHHFTKVSLLHSIKHDLKDMRFSVRRLRWILSDAMESGSAATKLLGEVEEAIERIGGVLGSRGPAGPHGVTSFVEQIRQVAAEFFEPRHVDIQLDEDAVFRDLTPELIREALRHLLENAQAAIRLAEPADPSVRYLVVRGHLLPSGERELLIMNPGANPDSPEIGQSREPDIHGWSNARWFFEEVLGCTCNFELRDDGPKSGGLRSNCVAIRFPVNQILGIVWSPMVRT